jgi:hypothetical protein
MEAELTRKNAFAAKRYKKTIQYIDPPNPSIPTSTIAVDPTNLYPP